MAGNQLQPSFNPQATATIPQVQPAVDPATLNNTMTQPKPVEPVKVTPAVSKTTSPAPTPAPNTAPAPAPTPGAPTPADPNSSQFANYLSTIQDKMKANNVLADSRAKLITALYDRPLTPDEVATLPPNVQQAIQTGDKRDIEMQIRLMNDQIQGRTGSLDSSVQFLSQEYDKTLETAAKQKQDAIDNVVKFVQAYGDKAGAAMKSLYGPEYLNQLSKFGINVDDLASLPTVTQAANNSKYGATPGVGLGAYDLSSYATDPNWDAGVSTIYKKIGTISSADDAQQYISSVKPNSPITGAMVMSAADKYGIDPGALIAIMQQETQLGTDGSKGARQANYGNVGNTDSLMASGGSVAKSSPQAGVDAVASWLSNHADKSNNDVFAGALIKGTSVPSLISAYNGARNNAVATAMKKDPSYNQANAELQYAAAKKFAQSMNSTQMVRFNGLATSVVNTIDEVTNLADQMQNSGVPLMNKAKLAAYIQTNGNSPQGQLATKYLTAVNTLKEEFANLANGGYAPTDAAWSLANSQIDGNYGDAQLKSSLSEVQRLINYRVNAINSQGPNLGGLAPDPNQPLKVDDGNQNPKDRLNLGI